MPVSEAPELACFELLLRLAGRLPDRQLWRLRDWLASGALPELSQTLPLTLLRERIGLTAGELRLIATALLPHGADAGLISSLQEVDDVPELNYTFTSSGPGSPSLGDPLAVLLGAVLRGRTTVGDVRTCWRRSESDGAQKRVLLVTASTHWIALTGELQRIQCAMGEHDPCVEVLPADIEPPPYHWAAFEASQLLCTGDVYASSQLGHS